MRLGGSTLLLDYVVEQRGALLHLVVESLKNGDNPPSGASNLEIKVAKFNIGSSDDKERDGGFVEPAAARAFMIARWPFGLR